MSRVGPYAREGQYFSPTGIVIKQQKTYSMFYSNVTTKQINMNSYLIQVSSIFNNNYSFS